MTYVVYFDVLFLINFVMDCLVLNLLRIILKGQTTWYRIAMAGAAGAVWACMAVACAFLPRWAAALISWLGVGVLMIKITFSIQTWQELIKYLAGLYLATACLAGAAYGLYQHTRMWIWYTAGAYALSLALWRIFLQIRQRVRHYYPVTLYYGGQSNQVTALLDTGNHLYEPVSHRPVHILDYRVSQSLCPQAAGVVFIPFHSVGAKGMLPGIYLDSMVIGQGQKCVTINKPLVAISRQPLSPGGEYQMLLHEEEITSGEMNK